jgi:ParB-like chromosome segregation protein Spo0J
MTKKTLQSKPKLKDFLKTNCKGDQAKFIGEFEKLNQDDLKLACKTLKIQLAKSNLLTAKAILKELDNGTVQKKTDANNSGSKDNKTELKDDMETSANSAEDSSGLSGLALKVDPTISKLVPSMSKQEFELLKLSIVQYGLKTDDTISILEDGTIIDGHSRYKACQDLKIDVPVEMLRVVSEDAKEQIIKRKNLARRHLKAINKISLVLDDLKEIDKKLGKGTRAARDAKARKSQTSTATVQQYDFMEKYAPDRLENSVKQELETLSAAFKDEHRKYQEIKKRDKDLLERVKSQELTLDEALDLLKKKKEPKKQKEEPPQDPRVSIIEEVKEFAIRQIKKYNNGKLKFSDEPSGKALKEIMDKIDGMIERLGKEGK